MERTSLHINKRAEVAGALKRATKTVLDATIECPKSYREVVEAGEQKLHRKKADVISLRHRNAQQMSQLVVETSVSITDINGVDHVLDAIEAATLNPQVAANVRGIRSWLDETELDAPQAVAVAEDLIAITLE